MSAEKISTSVPLSTWTDRLARAAAEAERAVNLVPSENRLSPLARMALSTDFYNRYFFNDGLRDDFWEFRGGQDIGDIERHLAIPSLSELAAGNGSLPLVNVRPVSGLSAMQMAVSALAGPTGSPVGHVARSDGGHFATESLIKRMGFTPRQVGFRGTQPVTASFEAMGDPSVRLLYLDLQNFIGEVDVATAVKLARARNPGIRVHVDVSHVLGLIMGGVLVNPLDVGADSMGGSTHKTFPGPQKGVLFTRNDDIAEAFLRAQFDIVSSHHFAETISLGLAAREFQHFAPSYARQVVANARHLAAALEERGFAVQDADDVATHQVWARLDEPELVWRLTNVMKSAGIRLNVQTDLPGIPGPCLRLGTNEVTFQGAETRTMDIIARAMAQTRDTGICGPEVLDDVRASFAIPYYFPEVADIDRLIVP